MKGQIIQRLERIEKIIRTHFLMSKEILTFSEFCDFCGISESHGYKLTSTMKVPYYKPGGKLIYFKRSEIEDWILSSPIKTQRQLEQQAMSEFATSHAKRRYLKV